MAAALGASHAGWDARLFERAQEFSEVGAGVQLGPNVVRRLQAWGLQQPLQARRSQALRRVPLQPARLAVLGLVTLPLLFGLLLSLSG